MKKKTLSLILVPLLTNFAFLHPAQAVVPPPEGGYPGQNTAAGQNALLSLTSGTFNTASGYEGVAKPHDGGSRNEEKGGETFGEMRPLTGR